MLLREKRELTRQEIANGTGMSVPTVAAKVQMLQADGLVQDARILASTGGRKPQTVQFNPHARYAFGVQFASDHSSDERRADIILVNLDNEIQHEEHFDYTVVGDVDDIIAETRRRIARILRERGIASEQTLGAGVSLPGVVDDKKKVLRWAPNIDPRLGMNALDFRKHETDLPSPLFVENEAYAAAYAEFEGSATSRKRNLVYLAVNRGISAGIIVRGHILRGTNARAGDFGHMAVGCDGQKCTCGNANCWELYAGSGAVIRWYNETAPSSIKSTNEFRALLMGGDAVAAETWKRYLDYFALGLRNILLFVDPDAVIIGGEMAHFKEILTEPLKQRVFDPESLYAGDQFAIEVSRFGDRSSVLGAAMLPLQQFYYGRTRVG